MKSSEPAVNAATANRTAVHGWVKVAEILAAEAAGIPMVVNTLCRIT
jgi:hypothetical protein